MKKQRKALTKDEILDAIRKHRDILLKYKVREIGLFGSFVKGEQEDRSDIDLIVDFEEPTIENFMGLSSFLENLFGKKVEILTPVGVESIRINHIKEEIKRSIVYA
ncbi:MAG: nucleotidyltransferase [Deltaproteobacteria bacterium RBG_19FT_COMBO_46_12]|nr:MAG: nucleotidyltransferase [Deltaproteobacteria bacterium RBG_19FT_COMBO_46_12]